MLCRQGWGLHSSLSLRTLGREPGDCGLPENHPVVQGEHRGNPGPTETGKENNRVIEEQLLRLTAMLCSGCCASQSLKGSPESLGLPR